MGEGVIEERKEGRLRRLARKPATWVVAGLAVVVIGVGLALTQPWKLFLDVHVDEDFPVATGAGPVTTDGPDDASTQSNGAPEGGPEPTVAADEPGGAEAPSAPDPGFRVLSTGSFESRDHPATGEALLVELADGERYLRIEDLVTDNGPDLFVYLVAAPAEATNAEIDAAEIVNLGSLKGNVGNQNYEIAADVDLSRYSSVVIWCRRFTSAFGAAPIDLAS